jgi:hypothetical protein
LFAGRSGDTIFYLSCAAEMQTKVRTGICKPAKTTVTQMPDPESDVFKYTLAQSLSPHGTNVLCYRNNAIGLFGEKIGPKFAGGGFFVSLQHPGTTLDVRILG